MKELDLIKAWNNLRTHIISAQMGPTIILAAVVALAAFGKFDGASDAIIYLALGVVAASGILATITQYAAMGEANAICAELAKTKDLGPLGKHIRDSKDKVSLTVTAIIVLDIAVFGLTAWALLGN